MSVEIQLTDKYWLVSDAHSCALATRVERSRKDKRTGETRTAKEYRQQSWHATVEQVCQAAHSDAMRGPVSSS